MMSHDQLMAIITTMLVTKHGGVTQGTPSSDPTLKKWVETANAIVHAAAGTAGPRQLS